MRIILAFAFLGLFMASFASAESDFAASSAQPTTNGVFQLGASLEGLKRGWNPITIELADADGNKIDGAKIDLAYDMTGMVMDPPKAEITAEGNPGVYQTRVFIGMRGQYYFTFKVTAPGDKSDTVTLYQTIK